MKSVVQALAGLSSALECPTPRCVAPGSSVFIQGTFLRCCIQIDTIALCIGHLSLQTNLLPEKCTPQPCRWLLVLILNRLSSSTVIYFVLQRSPLSPTVCRIPKNPFAQCYPEILLMAYALQKKTLVTVGCLFFELHCLWICSGSFLLSLWFPARKVLKLVVGVASLLFVLAEAEIVWLGR